MREFDMHIVEIDNNKVPIALTKTYAEEPYILGCQGIVNVNLSIGSKAKLEDVTKYCSNELLNVYNAMTKRIINRSVEKYDKICATYFMRYEKELKVESKEIIHAPFVLEHLGWANNNYNIVLNEYMQYMQKETIKYTIYHELCHLHTLKYNNSFGHNPDFYDVLYQKYSPMEIKKIMEN